MGLFFGFFSACLGWVFCGFLKFFCCTSLILTKRAHMHFHITCSLNLPWLCSHWVLRVLNTLGPNWYLKHLMVKLMELYVKPVSTSNLCTGLTLVSKRQLLFYITPPHIKIPKGFGKICLVSFQKSGWLLLLSMPDSLNSQVCYTELSQLFTHFVLKLMLFHHYNSCNLIKKILLWQTRHCKEPT